LQKESSSSVGFFGEPFFYYQMTRAWEGNPSDGEEEKWLPRLIRREGGVRLIFQGLGGGSLKIKRGKGEARRSAVRGRKQKKEGRKSQTVAAGEGGPSANIGSIKRGRKEIKRHRRVGFLWRNEEKKLVAVSAEKKRERERGASCRGKRGRKVSFLADPGRTLSSNHEVVRQGKGS